MLSTAGDTGKEIEAKKKAVKKQKTKLEELKKHYTIARFKYMRLERELAALQPSIINLPSEVLLIILKLSIFENHKLKCRATEREISEDKWNVGRRPCPGIPRVVLKVKANFIPHIAERLHSGFSSLPDDNQVLIDHDLLDEWLENLNYADLEDDEEMTMECLPEYVLLLLQLLVGERREHIERWESLKLHFSVYSPDLAFKIWNMIHHPIPNLSYNLAFLDDHEGNCPLILVPDISRVRHLTIDGLTNWDFLYSFSSSIQTLVVQTFYGDCHSLDLMYFANLTSLTLRRAFNKKEIGPEIPDTISLPLLEELVLIGYFAGLHRTKFILPKLQTLVLKWRCYRSTLTLPDLHPARVHWEPFNQRICENPDLADAVLRKLIRPSRRKSCWRY